MPAAPRLPPRPPSPWPSVPTLEGLRLFKTDLWDEAKNTRILAWASRQGARAYGVDISEPMVIQARAAFDREPLHGTVADIHELPFRAASFDAIYGHHRALPRPRAHPHRDSPRAQARRPCHRWRAEPSRPFPPAASHGGAPGPGALRLRLQEVLLASHPEGDARAGRPRGGGRDGAPLHPGLAQDARPRLLFVVPAVHGGHGCPCVALRLPRPARAGGAEARLPASDGRDEARARRMSWAWAERVSPRPRSPWAAPSRAALTIGPASPRRRGRARRGAGGPGCRKARPCVRRPRCRLQLLTHLLQVVTSGTSLLTNKIKDSANWGFLRATPLGHQAHSSTSVSAMFGQ